MQEKMKVPELRFAGFTEDWEQRKLGEICSEIGDGLHSAPVYDENGEYFFINGNNLVNGQIVINPTETKKVSEETYEKNDKYLDDSTVLLSINGTIGNLAYYAGEKVMLGKSAAYLKVKDIDKTFLYTSLQTSIIMESFMLSLTGTTIKNLGLEAIKNTRISIPNNKEQAQIGAYFTNLDHLITLHQRKIERFVNIKSSMLNKMFPKDGATVPEVRFAGFTDDWEQRKVGDLIEDYVERTVCQNQYPVLTSSQQQGIVLQEDYFADRQVTTNDNIGYFVLPRGYFTYRSRSDTNVFVFNRNDLINRGIISYFYPVFAPKACDSNFLLRRLNHGIGTQLSMAAEGTGQKVLSHKKFKNMIVDVSSVLEQKKIGQLFETLDHLITLHQRKLEKLKNIKKSCLEKMFV